MPRRRQSSQIGQQVSEVGARSNAAAVNRGAPPNGRYVASTWSRVGSSSWMRIKQSL